MQNMLLSFWTWLENFPMWAIILIVFAFFALIAFILGIFAHLKDVATGKESLTVETEIDVDFKKKASLKEQANNINKAYYRYQLDRQPVIKRSEEQQRIYDEYFVVKNVIKSKPLIAIIAVIIGIAGICVACFCRTGILIGVGIGLFALGLILFLVYTFTRKYTPKKLMSSKEYEELVSKKIAALNVPDLGMKRLGLDSDEVREIAPVMLRDKSFTKTSFKVYDSSDGTLHSSTQWVAMLYFTDEQLLLYKIEFDMCCNVQTEWTSVFYYKDICDVSTHFSENVIALGKEKFAYRTMDFVFITTNSKMGFSMSGKNHGAASIASMRQKIRERKRPRRRY